MIPLLTAHLWQSTVFVVAIALLTLPFRGNRAQVRYWLWLSASIKFLVPFALLMSVGSALQSWVPTAVRKIATPAVSYTLEQFGEPVLYRASPPSLPSTGETIHWIPVAVLVVWLCGFLTIAVIRFRNWLRIRAAVRAGTATDIHPTVEVRVSPGLLEPGVVGLLRPILLLPEGITERLTPSELKAVLEHELCHVHRRDNLFAAIHMVVETVFWFHPLVWWIGARLVEERERACDEEVLQQGNAADVYADAILNVCKLYVESPLACVSGVSGAGIRRRIEIIMSNRRLQALNPAKKLLLASAGFAALGIPVAIGLVIGVGNVPTVRAQSPTPQVTQVPVEPAQIAQAQTTPKPPATVPNQPVAARPKFEVASIHPCDPNAVVPGGRGRGGGGGAGPSPDRVTRNCVTVMALLQDAYVRFADGQNGPPYSRADSPIEGAPAWIGSDLYTVEAKADGDSDRSTMLGPMMQSLLEERFHLKLHRETRTVPALELTAARGGSKLKEAVDNDGSCAVDIPPEFIPHGPTGALLPGFAPGGHTFQIPLPPGMPCKLSLTLRNGPNRLLVTRGMALGEFSRWLVGVTDHPILDKTGLSGKFDVRLEFSPDETTTGAPVADQPDAATDIPAGATLFTALEQQLGLKLVPVKGTREFIVIDHIDRPSKN